MKKIVLHNKCKVRGLDVEAEALQYTKFTSGLTSKEGISDSIQ